MTDEAANAVRSPAQFFFEIGFSACLAEAYARNGAMPFVASDAIIERAWSIAGDAHDDPVEFARYLALSDRAAAPRDCRTNQQYFDSIGTPLRDRPGHTPECSRFETHSPWACDCHVRASADREGDPVLISREKDDDCGCPEEHWEAFGLDIHMHLSDLGSNAHADGGDWGEAEIDVRASTHDLTRAAIFGWAKMLVQPTAPARQPIADLTGVELTCDFARALPSGGMDDSTFEAVETALDRADVPCTEGSRFVTLVERIGFLAARADKAEQSLRAIPLHRLDPSMRDAIRAALAAPQAGGKGGDS